MRSMALGSLAAEPVLLALDVSTVLHDGDHMRSWPMIPEIPQPEVRT